MFLPVISEWRRGKQASKPFTSRTLHSWLPPLLTPFRFRLLYPSCPLISQKNTPPVPPHCLSGEVKNTPFIWAICCFHCATKVVPDSLELVHFSIQLVQVKFWGNSNYISTVKVNLDCRIFAHDYLARQ